MEWDLIAILAAVGFVAGVIDATAGGGGLLSLPTLLMAGLDPVAALATNKLQGSVGLGTSAATFARAGHIDFRGNWLLVAMAFVGAGLGVLAAGVAPTGLLKAVMPVMLIVMAVYFAVSPRLSSEEVAARISHSRFAFFVVPPIAFYDGFFGPGAGSFYLLGFVALRGQAILRALAHTRLLNFVSNFTAFVIFAAAGQVVWSFGLAMCAGQVLGAQVGSRLAIKQGVKVIRPMLVVVSCAMAVKLLLQ